MPDAVYVLGALIVMFAVTFALRGLPFMFIGPLRGSPLVVYLNRSMPVGIMVILIVYTLRNVPLTAAPFGIPQGAGLVVVVALHLWKSNAVLSVVGGAGVCVLLMHLL